MAATSAAVEQRNQDATVHVGGLDDAADEELVWELFVQAGPVVSVHMPRDKVSGRHQNYAFVEFRGEEDAEYAVKVLNMTRLFGKLLRVSKASADRARLAEGVGANLFIGNLDPSVDEKLLYDVFSAFGGIPMPPKVMRDPDTGASKGFGFVSFDCFEASDLAIESMHGQFLANRQISVQYAFKRDSRSERHGTAAERLLAASARARAGLATRAGGAIRPNLLFAAAPGQVVSAVPAGHGSGMIGAGASAPPPMLPPTAILPAGMMAHGAGGGGGGGGSAAVSAAIAALAGRSAGGPPGSGSAAGIGAGYSGMGSSAGAGSAAGSSSGASGSSMPPPLPPMHGMGPPPLPAGAAAGAGGAGFARGGPPPLPPAGFPGMGMGMMPPGMPGGMGMGMGMGMMPPPMPPPMPAGHGYAPGYGGSFMPPPLPPRPMMGSGPGGMPMHMHMSGHGMPMGMGMGPMGMPGGMGYGGMPPQQFPQQGGQHGR